MSAMDEFLEGLTEVELEVPTVFTWDEEDYVCSASGFSKAGKLEQSGYGIDEGGTIVVRVALFGAGPYPQRGEELEFKGTTYRIDSMTTAQGGTFFRITCVNASRGA
jgi:hypothetical protein